MIHIRAVALFVVVLFGVSAFAFLSAAPPAQAATTYHNDQLIESAGPTSAFGGGNYRFIEFGTDAAFGIVWGNASHANSVYVVAIKARYLGVGQVYYASNGTLLKANQPVKVYTIYAAQLQDIIEYKDVTGDGVANYTRTYNSTTRSWSNYAFATDVGYKFVNLTANWVPGNVTRANGTTYRSWTFNLTATNLSYYNISSHAKLTGALPLVEFTFHLNASLVQIDNYSVPQWNITVGQVGSHYVLTNVVRMSSLTLQSIKAVHYDVKWDQLIQGWTYDNRNNNAATRRILLESGTIVANYVPPEVVAGWALLHYLGDEGSAHYNSTAGPQTADNSTGVFAAPHVFGSPMLDIGGTWTRIARLEWTTNSTVDSATQPLTAQLVGGFAFSYLDSKGLWYGFVLLVGLNYVGGNSILHDPTVSADVNTDLQFQSIPAPPSGAPAPSNYGAVIVGIVIILVLVLAAVALILRSRRKQEPPAPPAQPPLPPPQS